MKIKDKMKLKKPKGKVIIIIIVIIIVCVMLFRCSGNAGSMDGTPETVERKDIISYVKFSGTVEAVDYKDVYTKVPGNIKEVKVKKGDMVKEGDILAIMDTDDVNFDIQVKEATLEKEKLQSSYDLKDKQMESEQLNEQLENGLNSSVEEAQKNLMNAQQSFTEAADAYNEFKLDYETGKNDAIVKAKQELATASVSYEEAKKNKHSNHEAYAVADTNVKQCQQNLELAKEKAQRDLEDKEEAFHKAEDNLKDAEREYNIAVLLAEQSQEKNEAAVEKQAALSYDEATELEIEKLKNSLDKYVIYANTSGCITDLKLKENEYLDKNTLTATITNFDKLKVAVKIDEYDIEQVHEGDSAIVYINATGKEYEGKITSVDKVATVENNVSFVGAVVEFDADEYVKQGFSAQVKIMKTNVTDVIAIPIGAIKYREDNTPYVLVSTGNGTEERNVKMGESDENYVEITEGLSEGETIIVPFMPDIIPEMEY